MCIGKALTGGYMTLAATLCTKAVAENICAKPPGVFMHGPTFMANPLACAVAKASVELLLDSPWEKRVHAIGRYLHKSLQSATAFPWVADVRVLGAIGVVELKEAVDTPALCEAFVRRGVWVRPFGKLVYVMPPFIITKQELAHLCGAVLEVIKGLGRA